MEAEGLQSAEDECFYFIFDLIALDRSITVGALCACSLVYVEFKDTRWTFYPTTRVMHSRNPIARLHKSL